MGKNAMLHIGFFPMRHTYIFIQNAANEVQRNRFRGTNRLIWTLYISSKWEIDLQILSTKRLRQRSDFLSFSTFNFLKGAFIPLCRCYHHQKAFFVKNPLNVERLEHRPKKMMEKDCTWRFPLGDQTCNLGQICIYHSENKRYTMVLLDVEEGPRDSTHNQGQEWVSL